MKITINPHITGMGHKVRCNLIAKKLKEIEPKIKIKFLVRRDDPIPPGKWLEFDFVKGKFRRGFEIVTSSCLIEDGIWFDDFRLRLLKKLGGKIVAISNTYGFKPDYNTVSKYLDITNLILIPWPKKLFRWPNELSALEYKVKRVDPIFYEPKSKPLENKKTDLGLYKIYVSISTETEKIFPIIHSAVKNLKNSYSNLSLITSDSSKDFKSDAEHVKLMMGSDLVIAMGTSTIFQCCYFGIPRICIPLPWNEDQMLTAKKMMDDGTILSIPLNELNKDSLTKIISNIFDDSNIRNEMVGKGRDLVPKPGQNEAAKLILQILD